MTKLVNILRLLFTAANPFRKQMASSARFELVSSVVRLMGYRVYNQDCWWKDDTEYMQLWLRFAENNGKIHDRRFNLYNLVKATRKLPGDTAECGVYRGAGSHLILSALREEQSQHHIFDSFAGLSEPEGLDRPQDGRVEEWQAGDLITPESVVESNLAAFANRIRLYRGWIPERFIDVADRQFRFVHIDVDLYQPTRDALEFFYPRMVRGGMIVCDDYGYSTCPGATRAMDEFFSANGRESIVHLTTGTGLIVKQ